MIFPSFYTRKGLRLREVKTPAWYHVYVESKTIQLNEYAKQKQTHRHRRQTSGYQRGKVGVGGKGQIRGMGLTYELLCKK